MDVLFEQGFENGHCATGQGAALYPTCYTGSKTAAMGMHLLFYQPCISDLREKDGQEDAGDMVGGDVENTDFE